MKKESGHETIRIFVLEISEQETQKAGKQQIDEVRRKLLKIRNLEDLYLKIDLKNGDAIKVEGMGQEQIEHNSLIQRYVRYYFNNQISHLRSIVDLCLC